MSPKTSKKSHLAIWWLVPILFTIVHQTVASGNRKERVSGRGTIRPFILLNLQLNTARFLYQSLSTSIQLRICQCHNVHYPNLTTKCFSQDSELAIQLQTETTIFDARCLVSWGEAHLYLLKDLDKEGLRRKRYGKIDSSWQGKDSDGSIETLNTLTLIVNVLMF